MKVYEKIDKELQNHKNDVVLLSLFLERAEINNDIELPWKLKHFFDNSENHYFVTIKQKEIQEKFCTSQSKISRIISGLINFGAIQKLSQSTYAINKEWLVQEFKGGYDYESDL